MKKNKQTKEKKFAATFFVIEEAKETVLYFSKETIMVLFPFNIILIEKWLNLTLWLENCLIHNLVR